MLSQVDKDDVLINFPNIKLSYENIIHKKVSKENYDFIIGIPEGKKCFAWFTIFREKPTCFILELDNKFKHKIQNIKIVNCCFSSSLSYGTILYGTLFHHFDNPFFTIEDIYMYKGVDCVYNNYNSKLNKFCHILKNDIKQLAYNNYFVIFGLPIIAKTYEEFNNYISRISYNLYCIQYKNNKNNISYILSIDEFNKSPVEHVREVKTKSVEQPTNIKQSNIFIIRPNIQNDIYNLYTVNGNEYVGLACIPDYKTSIMMNNLFRNIKENNDLDALEESDDEEEFENSNVDKFVYLNKEYKMVCNYNKKFKKWVPIKITS